jgi:hypothetical protein
MVNQLLNIERRGSNPPAAAPNRENVQPTRSSLAAMLAGITACYVSERCCCRTSC